MVLLLKGKEEYQVIGLVNFLWKVSLVVNNFSFKRSVVLHDALHGFREGLGTGMDNLEANMA